MRGPPTQVSNALLSILRQKFPMTDLSRIPQSEAVQRSILGDVLIQSNDRWDEDTLEAVDKIWKDEREFETPLPWTTIPNQSLFGNTRLAVWKGDITQLAIDGIVNAANDEGLGCFVPDHRCIDNTIHRRAGPRLRAACREAMQQRRGGESLATGTPPIVTDAYHLPCQKVLHVTGPRISEKGRRPRNAEIQNLALAYRNTLDACVAHSIRSVAFCGISTGLFGFPKQDAANIAVSTVLEWLEEHPDTMEAVVFDVFSEEEEELYNNELSHRLVSNNNTVLNKTTPGINNSAIETEKGLYEKKMAVAQKWMSEADAVLICAGAGMSVKEGEMVYVNEADFERAYPWFTKWGYKTGYEAMGLVFDRRVPETAKWAFWAQHMYNMRWGFDSNKGYDTLLDTVKDKDYFVLTSNVDGCFERSGFAKDRIYTPQGEWTYYQCRRACRPDSVFESKDMIEELVANISPDGHIPQNMVPRCPNCGGQVFGNVRADGSFLHTEYEEQNDAARAWMKRQIESDRNVVIVEIGAGFNTPSITRLPVESFARELGGTRGQFVRINPSDPEVPADLRALAIAKGWEALNDIATADMDANDKAGADDTEEEKVLQEQTLNGETVSYEDTLRIAKRFGHFDWNEFLVGLKN